jgi:hypothetical protein
LIGDGVAGHDVAEALGDISESCDCTELTKAGAKCDERYPKDTSRSPTA